MTISPAAPDGTAGLEWSWSVSTLTYFVPDAEVLVNPNVVADHGPLPLEAHYNAEARRAASMWAGDTLAAGDTFAITFTPMIGGVFGTLDGVAPGYNLSLRFREGLRLEPGRVCLRDHWRFRQLLLRLE